MEPRHWREHLPPDPVFQVEELTARRSLPAAWAEVWGVNPSAPLLYEAGSVDGDRWVTTGEFDDRTRRAAATLRSLGLRPGDRLLWSTGSSVPAVVANVAALRAGLVVVPANAAYTERELAHIVTDVRPAAAVVDHPDRARWVADASTRTSDGDGGRPSCHQRRPPGGNRRRRSAVGRCRARRRRPRPLGPGRSGSDRVHLGDDRRSQGRRPHPREPAGQQRVGQRHLALGPRRPSGPPLPIFHGHGLCVALYTSLLRARRLVLPRFDADAVLDASSDQAATMFFGVPTMYHRLAASPRVGELARLRLAVSGSAPSGRRSPPPDQRRRGS